MIQNIVFVAKLYGNVSLQHCLHKLQGSRYNPKKIGCVFWNKTLIWNSGTLIVHAKSSNEALQKVNQICKAVDLMLKSIKIVNCVVSGCVGVLDLEKSSRLLGAFFEPELFNGMKVTLTKGVAMVFSNGKYYITGVTLDEIDNAEQEFLSRINVVKTQLQKHGF